MKSENGLGLVQMAVDKKFKEKGRDKNQNSCIFL